MAKKRNVSNNKNKIETQKPSELLLENRTKTAANWYRQLLEHNQNIIDALDKEEYEKAYFELGQQKVKLEQAPLFTKVGDKNETY